ncbi:MAG TPA: N-acetylmuramic acid 6-phosphate etherase, partial [Vicinamibacteria bacterium]
TKAALNAITTAAMVRLGGAYGNLNVGLRQTSAKLRDRAQRIVVSAAGVGRAEAARLLAAARDDVKTAIVMGRARVTAPEARRRLARAGGVVRKALRPPPGRRSSPA